jgi:hypothetical protein
MCSRTGRSSGPPSSQRNSTSSVGSPAPGAAAGALPCLRRPQPDPDGCSAAQRAVVSMRRHHPRREGPSVDVPAVGGEHEPVPAVDSPLVDASSACATTKRSQMEARVGRRWSRIRASPMGGGGGRGGGRPRIPDTSMGCSRIPITADAALGEGSRAAVADDFGRQGRERGDRRGRTQLSGAEGRRGHRSGLRCLLNS